MGGSSRSLLCDLIKPRKLGPKKRSHITIVGDINYRKPSVELKAYACTYYDKRETYINSHGTISVWIKFISGDVECAPVALEQIIREPLTRTYFHSKLFHAEIAIPSNLSVVDFKTNLYKQKIESTRHWQ